MTTPRSPNRSPTHRDIDPARLARLGLDVEELAEGGPITPDRVLELAAEQGKEPSQFYAALALATEIEQPVAPVTALFCVGICQQWGALPCVDRALEEWEQRKGGFAIVAKSCLDRCEQAPACEIRSPSGTVVLAPATPAAVAEAIAALVES